jgi:hypothetical protein
MEGERIDGFGMRGVARRSCELMISQSLTRQQLLQLVAITL